MAKNPVRGLCGLCREATELRESHLLPAAVYRLAREPGARNPNPVVVTTRGAVNTSRQVQEYFLCGVCEDRLSKGGEQYVLAECARPSGSFNLRSKLSALHPVGRSGEVTVYEVSGMLGARVEKYLYFGASVFWRASARSWTVRGSRTKIIRLGARYGEEFRHYLLGQAQFPANARVFLHVWSDAHLGFTSVVPSTYRVEGVLRHKFCIPGVLFILFLGGDAPRRHDLGALNSSDGHFMWLCPSRADSLAVSFAKISQAAKRVARRVPA